MTVDVRFEQASDIVEDEVARLYSAVGWTAYTRDMPLLMRSIAGSHRIATARSGDELVGLARVISDGATIAYLQDVLVHPSAQRAGLGRMLVETLLGSYEGIRQRVLLTDDEPGQRAFYESLGLVEAHDHEPPLRAFVRLG